MSEVWELGQGGRLVPPQQAGIVARHSGPGAMLGGAGCQGTLHRALVRLISKPVRLQEQQA